MQTGDIILFSDTTFLPSIIIEEASQSIYSHIGIIIKVTEETKDSFLNLEKGKTYILESTGFSDLPDAEDKKIKWGVQIRDFEKVKSEYNGRVFHRALQCVRDQEFYTKLEKIHNVIHDKSYNTSPLEWLSLLINKDLTRSCDSSYNDTDIKSFVCSTLVAYIYKNLDLISFDKGEDYSIIRPKDFGSENFINDIRRINFMNCIVETEVELP